MTPFPWLVLLKMRKNEKTTCKLRKQVIYLALHCQRVRQQQRTAGQPWGQALAGRFLFCHCITYLRICQPILCTMRKMAAGESAAPAPRRARGAHGFSIAEGEGFNWYFFSAGGELLQEAGPAGGPRRSRTPAARWRKFCATAGQGRHFLRWYSDEILAFFGRDTAMKQDKHKDSAHNRFRRPPPGGQSAAGRCAVIRGGAPCRHCRWRSDGTGYCLWPCCLRARIDGESRTAQRKRHRQEGKYGTIDQTADRTQTGLDGPLSAGQAGAGGADRPDAGGSPAARRARVSPVLDGMPRPSGHSDRVPPSAERLAEAEHAHNIALAEMRQARGEVQQAVGSVRDRTGREVLYRRYLLGQPLLQVSQEMMLGIPLGAPPAPPCAGQRRDAPAVRAGHRPPASFT